MDMMRLKFTGLSDLMMHSERLMNIFDPLVKDLKALTGKRKKTEEDVEAIARLEWELGMYFDKDLGPIVPAINIEGCIRDGGMLQKRGKDVVRAVQVTDDTIALQYVGPRSLDQLWTKGFRDLRAVGNQANKVMRCRPIFRGWSIEFSLAYDPAVFNASDLVRCAELAGRYVGLGDYTPRFGRFEVEKLNGK